MRLQQRTAHVVHTGSSHRLDPGIHLGGGQGEAAGAADADGADLLPLHEGLEAQEVHGGAEILCEDVRAGHIPGAQLSAQRWKDAENGYPEYLPGFPEQPIEEVPANIPEPDAEWMSF